MVDGPTLTNYILTRLIWLTKQIDVDNSLVTWTNLMCHNTLRQSDNMLATFLNLIFHILKISHCWFEIQATCTVFYFSSDQSLSCVWLFATPQTAAYQASLSFTISQSLLKLMSIESLLPPSHLILCIPFSSCLQSFPASDYFPMSWLFASGDQRIGASTSASVHQMNIQDWFPLGWTGWISLQSKGLSRVFSNTTVQKHQFFGAQPSL